MTIKFHDQPYYGSSFKNEQHQKVEMPTDFVTLDGKLGKIIHTGYHEIREHGFSGGYDTYAFIDQETLSSTPLKDGMIFNL